MSKVKYRYNPETLSYDRIETGFKFYLQRIFTYTLFSALMGFVFFFGYVYLIDSPREIKLERENARLLSQYEVMANKLDQVLLVLDDIQQDRKSTRLNSSHVRISYAVFCLKKKKKKKKIV